MRSRLHLRICSQLVHVPPLRVCISRVCARSCVMIKTRSDEHRAHAQYMQIYSGISQIAFIIYDSSELLINSIYYISLFVEMSLRIYLVPISKIFSLGWTFLFSLTEKNLSIFFIWGYKRDYQNLIYWTFVWLLVAHLNTTLATFCFSILENNLVLLDFWPMWLQFSGVIDLGV